MGPESWRGFALCPSILLSVLKGNWLINRDLILNSCADKVLWTTGLECEEIRRKEKLKTPPNLTPVMLFLIIIYVVFEILAVNVTTLQEMEYYLTLCKNSCTSQNTIPFVMIKQGNYMKHVTEFQKWNSCLLLKVIQTTTVNWSTQ